MKLNKILAVALAALTMTACSDDDEYPGFLGSVNTASGVTVNMPSAFSANENEQPFYLPVQVSGQTNGKVVVTVAVKEVAAGADTEPAKEAEHYNITSKTINIAAGETEGYIEVLPVWVTGEINDDRVFEVSIVSAQGATVGQKTCQVTIKNIDDPYTSMCGSWRFTAKDRSGNDVQMTLNMKTPAADDEAYGNELYAFGLGDAEYLLPFYDFQFDEETGQGTIKLGIGMMMTDGLAFNYGDPVGVAFPVCMLRTSTGVTLQGEVVCTFDSTYKTINFPQDVTIYAGLFSNSTGSFTGYGVGQYGEMNMGR